MSTIGPELPPHLLAKRKRRESDASQPRQHSSSDSDDEEAGQKRRRVVLGPAMPPAAIDERPPNPAQSDESSSEDEFGPSAADASSGKQTADLDTPPHDIPAIHTIERSKPKRDEWMTMAPAQDGLAARMDPSRAKARGFNTGRNARADGGQHDHSSAAWHETAEQKQKRLANEVLGIQGDAVSVSAKSQAKAAKGAVEVTARKSHTPTEQSRGPSLLQQHRGRQIEGHDDDLSKRGFDWEKDMAVGPTDAQKREMLNKATGYSSRFSKGSYL